MADVDLKTLQRWHEDMLRHQKRIDGINHFISILNVMKMESDVYASGVPFYERMDILMGDFEFIANNALREGDPLFRSLLAGLRSGFGTYVTSAAKLHEEAEKIATFFDKKEDGAGGTVT